MLITEKQVLFLISVVQDLLTKEIYKDFPIVEENIKKQIMEIHQQQSNELKEI
jgi:hypothetical protein